MKRWGEGERRLEGVALEGVTYTHTQTAVYVSLFVCVYVFFYLSFFVWLPDCMPVCVCSLSLSHCKFLLYSSNFSCSMRMCVWSKRFVCVYIDMPVCVFSQRINITSCLIN